MCVILVVLKDQLFFLSFGYVEYCVKESLFIESHVSDEVTGMRKIVEEKVVKIQ